MTTDTKTIALVLYPGLIPLDLIGMLQMLVGVPRIDPTFEVVVAEMRACCPPRSSRSSCGVDDRDGDGLDVDNRAMSGCRMLVPFATRKVDDRDDCRRSGESDGDPE